MRLIFSRGSSKKSEIWTLFTFKMANLLASKLDALSTREETLQWMKNEFMPEFDSLSSFLEPSWLPEWMVPPKVPREVALEAFKLANVLEERGFSRLAGSMVFSLANVCIPE